VREKQRAGKAKNRKSKEQEKTRAGKDKGRKRQEQERMIFLFFSFPGSVFPAFPVT
jgi:hypothetical protein